MFQVQKEICLQYLRKLMKNKLIPILISIIALFGLFIFLLPFISVPVNNYLLNNYSKKLFSINPPDKTVTIETGKNWGTLIGNSDHSDFFAYVVIKSDLSKEELFTYYKNRYNGKSQIGVYQVGSSSTEIFPVTNFIENLQKNSVNTENLYILYLFDYDYGWPNM